MSDQSPTMNGGDVSANPFEQAFAEIEATPSVEDATVAEVEPTVATPEATLEGEEVETPEVEAEPKGLDFDLSEGEEEVPKQGRSAKNLIRKFDKMSEEKQDQKVLNVINSGRKEEMKALAEHLEFDSVEDMVEHYDEDGGDDIEDVVETPTPTKSDTKLQREINELLRERKQEKGLRERDRMVSTWAKKNGLDADAILNDEQFIMNWHDKDLSKLDIKKRLSFALKMTPGISEKRLDTKVEERAKKESKARNMATLSSGKRTATPKKSNLHPFDQSRNDFAAAFES